MKPLPHAVAVLAFASCLGVACGEQVRAAPASQPAGRAAATTRPASRPSAAGGLVLVEVRSNQPFVHEATGFVFPPTVGAFRRVRVRRLDEAGQGVMVGYKDPDLKIALTVSVYAGDGIELGPHFDAVKTSLLQRKARLTSEGKWTLRQPDAAADAIAGAGAAGMRMMYEYIGKQDGVEQDLEAQAFLVPLGRSYVRYDAIYPAGDAKAARGRAGWFMEMLKLPEKTKAES
jgi:hypothetical protein